MIFRNLLQHVQGVFRQIAVAACLTLVAQGAQAAAEKELPDPHWTGRHCTECHVEAGKPRLRFDHDVNRVCLRCHFKNSSAGGELHPVGMALRDYMQGSEGAAWPVSADGLTCLTCHAVRMQMHKDEAGRRANPKFLRGGQPATLNEFCFKCHQKQLFQKVNPHRQLNAAGEIQKNICLFCHDHPPDADLERVRATATLKNTRSSLCTGCHGDLKAGHRAHADISTIEAGRQRDGYLMQRFEPALNEMKETKLPLIDGAIHCATCHNPHEAGVLEDPLAAAGAGKPYFLRSDKVIALCVFCHTGKDAAEKRFLARPEHLYAAQDGGAVSHVPWERKECKACHAIDPGKQAARDQRYACLRAGCHSADRFEGDFRHIQAGEHTCAICHSPHTSANGHLLAAPERLLCRTCHPLVGAETTGARHADGGPDRHALFGALYEQSGVAADSGCVFCHFLKHKKLVGSVPIDVCLRCHTSIGDVRSRAAHKKGELHQRFDERRCTACHEPHAAEYRYLLKQPRGTYAQ